MTFRIERAAAADYQLFADIIQASLSKSLGISPPAKAWATKP